MQFVIKIDEKQHIAYIRKEIVEAFGLRLKFQPNTKAAIVYSEGIKASEVVKSVEILLADLRLRADDEARVKAETATKEPEA
jgi:hypothetical protein